MRITQALLDNLTAQAAASPRLRMNFDLRNSAEDGSQRMLNAIEPVTGFSSMIPAVFKCLMLFTTYSQANRFLDALSSKTPLPVSSTASFAK